MKSWLRPLPFALLAAAGLSAVGRAPVDDAAPSRSAALCGTLARAQRITCKAEDVVWLDGPTGITGAMAGHARALVRGRDASASEDQTDVESLDLLVVEARLSPEGQLLDLVGAAHNLTRSGGADEGLPIVRGSLAAYLVEIDGQPQALQVLDFAGHDAHAYDELSRAERLQVKLADLQTTGQMRGVKKTVFTLVPAPKKASLAFRADGMLVVTALDAAEPRTFTIDPVAGTVLDSPEVRVTAETVAKPSGFSPWMSDRLRAASWFGDDRNQALKAIVFTTLEWVKGQRAAITGDNGAAEAESDLGSIQQAPPSETTSFTDPETNWPPKPLEPIMKPALAGEGQWIRLDDDPFITPIPSIQAPFVTTFVRTDPGAQQTRVYVTLWDPRLAALHMQAGTVEPVSATGEAGPGQIPRTPEVIRHVVAGFNGGFQATHGEFGMQVDGVLYLPPKPYGATVLEMRDGSTAFAAWPKDAAVPDDVLSFRQNMTFMVQDDRYNPWGRAWWGGVPPGWHDAIHTTRSGLCLTKEGYVAYLFGHDIGPEPLGRAMLAARCEMGMHLDMNPGLAGFEFYNVQPAQSFKPLGRPLQPDWEYEGTMKELPEFKFRSRRMTRSMGHILFPRYVGRDARDFFYLTTRMVLPGAPIEGATPFRVKGLPQHGFPYATAISSLPLGGKRVRIMRLDPRAVVPVAIAEEDKGNTVVVLGRPARKSRDAGVPVETGDRKLWLGDHIFTIDKTARGSELAAVGAPPALARGAVGIGDEDGILQWIELLPEDAPSAETSEAMLKLLAGIGCSQRGLVSGELRAFLGGTVDVGGEPAIPGQVTARLVRSASPAAREIFPDTAIVPQAVWQPLQSQRVKWRPTLAPPDKPAASASASASGVPSAPPTSPPTPSPPHR